MIAITPYPYWILQCLIWQKLSSKIEWPWILLLSHKGTPVSLPRVVCVHYWWICSCVISFKSHEDTRGHPERSNAQSRGLTKLIVWILGLLVLVTYFGNQLSLHFFLHVPRLLLCCLPSVQLISHPTSLFHASETPCTSLRAPLKEEGM